jgi:hypothetical protein
MAQKPRQQPQSCGAILADILAQAVQKTPQTRPAPPEAEPATSQEDFDERGGHPEGQGHYDLDLAEYPLFQFHTRRVGRPGTAPLCYRDTITGPNGQRLNREWLVHPGPFGFGGPTTQALLYDLLQLYIEQGAEGSQIQFGTLRSLFLRRGRRNPSRGDYQRMRRDLDILRGYDIHCQNAFWDGNRRAYVSMNWRLFGAVFFFRAHPGEQGLELPFGFIEVSPVLRQAVLTRGFFALGFDHQFFHGLKPLEQRLAVYLAKKFTSQQVHRRYVEDLARALPLGAARPRDNLALLKKTAQGLLGKKLPLLASFAVERSRDGRDLAVFFRGQVPARRYLVPTAARMELAPGVASLVDRIVLATGNAGDRRWWTHCAARLGPAAVDRALGQLKEATSLTRIRNPGGLLTKIFKDIATDIGVAIC